MGVSERATMHVSLTIGNMVSDIHASRFLCMYVHVYVSIADKQSVRRTGRQCK